jgi:integrase
MKKLPTAKQVENWKTPGRHAVGFGAYLQITGDNGRSWLFRYKHAGRARHVGLGSVAEVSLADARNKAIHYRTLLREQGIDPLGNRAAIRARAAAEAAKSITFQECAERYIAAHEAAWRNPVHRKQWPATLAAYVYPVFGNVPVSAVDTALVTRALEPIWTAKPETAGRVRGRIESVLDWAKARGARDGENPARWRGYLDKLLPNRRKVRSVKHHAALPYTDLPAFLAGLRERDGIAARALEFAILTAGRTGEVLGARWDEIRDSVWTVPADRMKAGKLHRVPLSGRAAEILASLPRAGAFIFPGQGGGKPLSNMALLVTLRRIGRGDLTAHGFRSTFRDWVSERTNYPREVAEAALAHAIGAKEEAAYRRGDLFDKRRRLMAEWAAYCESPPAAGEVLPLRRP